MRRRDDQGTAVAFGLQYSGNSNADDGLAAAHLAVDDRGAFAVIDQQLGHGVDHIGLGGKRRPLQARQDDLAVRPHLPGVNGRIGAVERIEQLVAELRNEVLQADRQFR